MPVPLAKCAKSRKASLFMPSVLSTGTTGSVVKMRFPASSSTATPVNGPGAVQRTDPTKSDVSAFVNICSMNRASCPLASKEISSSSSTEPSFINWQFTPIASSPGLWISAAVLIPPAWRRAGKMASWTGWLAPTPATPMPGRSKRRTPPMGPSAATVTDPVTRSPGPRVEIVSSPKGSISV